MLRSCVGVAVILFLTSGCSHLHPATGPRAESVQNETSRSEAAATTERTSAESASSVKDRDPHQLSIGETAFAVVYLPVHFTCTFVWWLMNGCPD